jgi:hypothetical protein
VVTIFHMNFFWAMTAGAAIVDAAAAATAAAPVFFRKSLRFIPGSFHGCGGLPTNTQWEGVAERLS